MEKTLHFIALYNAEIIQGGFGIVFLLIIIYVYRLFFMANVSDSAGAGSINTEVLEEKLNIIIDQQKQRPPTPAAAAVAQKVVDGGATAEEVDRLKAEIYNMRQQAIESDKKIAELSSGAASVEVTPAKEAVSAEAAATDPAEQKEMVTKIQELESRLSEYEIIADDIAELSQLRADNAKLIEEISLLKSNTPGKALTSTESPLPIESVAASENSKSAPVSEESLLASDVTPQEQSSIEDFEKTIVKKENE